MEAAGRRDRTTNYHQLAGMASNKDRKSAQRLASVKSKRSDKSEVGREDEVERLEQQLDDLREKIDNNLAFVAETYESVQRWFGTEFETDVPIKDNITPKEAVTLQKLQEKELEDMDQRMLQLKEWQVCLDLREKLLDKRRPIEVILC